MVSRQHQQLYVIVLYLYTRELQGALFEAMYAKLLSTLLLCLQLTSPGRKAFSLVYRSEAS